jgi:hypothetical protein
MDYSANHPAEFRPVSGSVGASSPGSLAWSACADRTTILVVPVNLHSGVLQCGVKR